MKLPPPHIQPILLPAPHTEPARKSQPQGPLQGADLYVARLGWCGKPPRKAHPASPGHDHDDEDLASSTASLQLSASSSRSDGSLYDELSFASTSNSAHSSARSEVFAEWQTAKHDVRESRPCYRCISYMHAAGIKRVFWTTQAGTWEGRKVRDLVEGFEGEGGGVDGEVVFITKHEVLRMRRVMMGEGR